LWADGVVVRSADSGRFDVITPAADTDGDGLPDESEFRHCGDITNMTSGTDADEDSLSNFQEFLAGTDPTNRSSCLALCGVSNLVSVADTGVVVRPQSVTGRYHRIRLEP
jgi:hypothetical protein